MKSQTIKIRGVDVEIYWGEGPGVGMAVHTVPSADLDEGTAAGPNDGEEFELDGRAYELGQHDYETGGDETTCSAAIYELEAE